MSCLKNTPGIVCVCVYVLIQDVALGCGYISATLCVFKSLSLFPSLFFLSFFPLLPPRFRLLSEYTLYSLPFPPPD